jgi:hypothetical protein
MQPGSRAARALFTLLCCSAASASAVVVTTASTDRNDNCGGNHTELFAQVVAAPPTGPRGAQGGEENHIPEEKDRCPCQFREC